MKVWGLEVSASVLLVCEQVEDVEPRYLQAAGEEVEDAEALNLEAGFAVGFLVEVGDIEASYSERAAER